MSSAPPRPGIRFVDSEAGVQQLIADEALLSLLTRLIVESGRAYFTAFYGSEAKAAEYVARGLSRPNSVFSAAHLTLLYMEGALAGCMVALPGSELEKRQKADLGFVLQTFSPAARIELVNRIRGSSLIAATAEPSDYYIRALTVAPNFRGRGIGRVLLQHVAERAERMAARSCKLDVYASNEAAVRLYRACGFTAVCETPDPLTHDLIYTMTRPVRMA